MRRSVAGAVGQMKLRRPRTSARALILQQEAAWRLNEQLVATVVMSVIDIMNRIIGQIQEE